MGRLGQPSLKTNAHRPGDESSAHGAYVEFTCVEFTGAEFPRNYGSRCVQTTVRETSARPQAPTRTSPRVHDPLSLLRSKAASARTIDYPRFQHTGQGGGTAQPRHKAIRSHRGPPRATTRTQRSKQTTALHDKLVKCRPREAETPPVPDGRHRERSRSGSTRAGAPLQTQTLGSRAPAQHQDQGTERLRLSHLLRGQGP